MVRASKVFTILALFCASASAAADCDSNAEDETSLLQKTTVVNHRTEPEQFPEDIIEETETEFPSDFHHITNPQDPMGFDNMGLFDKQDPLLGIEEIAEDLGDDAMVGSGRGPAFDAFEANKAKAAPPMVAEESQREAFEDTVQEARDSSMQSAADSIAADRSSLEANAQANKRRIAGALEGHAQTVQAAVAQVKHAKHEYADTKAHEAFVKNAAIAGLRQGVNAGVAAVGQLKRQDDAVDLRRQIEQNQEDAAAAHAAHIQANMDAVNAATARKAEDLDHATQTSADITSGVIDSTDDTTGHVEEDIDRVDPFVTARGESVSSDWNDGTAQAQDSIASAAAGDWPP